MINKLYTETKALIDDKLKSVKTANGYPVTAGVYPGWVQLYEEKFARGEDGYAFPAFFVEYSKDANQTNPQTADNKCVRSVNVVGAVSVAHDKPELVTQKLDELLICMKAALATIPAGQLKMRVEIPEVKYSFAESRTYAMFSATVNLTLTEKWEK